MTWPLAADVNADLADTFGNLVNRVLKFVFTRYTGFVPTEGQVGAPELQLSSQLAGSLQTLRGHLDRRSLRKAAEEVRAIWRIGAEEGAERGCE